MNNLLSFKRLNEQYMKMNSAGKEAGNQESGSKTARDKALRVKNREVRMEE
jgi:hypothetical protein